MLRGAPYCRLYTYICFRSASAGLSFFGTFHLVSMICNTSSPRRSTISGRMVLPSQKSRRSWPEMLSSGWFLAERRINFSITRSKSWFISNSRPISLDWPPFRSGA